MQWVEARRGHGQRASASVAEADRRYPVRCRAPSPNPERVVLEIVVARRLGSVR